MGTYDELLASSFSFAELLENINQHEEERRSISFSNQQSIIESEKDETEDDHNSSPKNIESKQEGTVNFSVYLSYVRAGINVFVGLILLFIIYSTQQTMKIYSNWWLAEWTNEENYRYRNITTNCTSIQQTQIERIKAMSESQWISHRNQRLYTFAAFVAGVCLLILLRIIISRLIFLNAARILHNKLVICMFEYLPERNELMFRMFKHVIRSPILFFDTNPVGKK